ncbi:MAG: Gfo/Idh/MocA family protein [bacterium]
MDKQTSLLHQSPSVVSRRRFLGGTLAASALGGFMFVPRRVLGGGGSIPPSDKLNTAFIGTGSQGLRVMLEFLKQPEIQAVAVCDPNLRSADYPQWGKTEFRDAVRELLETNSGWDWLSTDQEIRLTHSMTCTAGVSGRDPCKQIVEAYYGKLKPSGEYRGCAAYSDFRDLLEQEAKVDAVVVGTPDHLHAAVSVAAMKKGKHVFCQKPMTRSVAEARRMAEVAKEAGVATQVAVGNQASEDTRRLREWIAAGTIGPVREVINWSSRPFWPQAVERPAEAQQIPEGLDWDLWLGPAPERPFHFIYLPFVWRGWHDFGCGALGDMGCYSFDTIFRVLNLDAPVSVEASSTEMYAETYPQASIIHFQFPARGDQPPVKVTWYDGGLKPPRPAELEEDRLLDKEGLMFIGDGGVILCEFSGGEPKLIPEAKMKAFQQPPKTLPRSPGNDREWIEACRGGKNKPGADFEFSSRVTETILLGNVALRAGQRLAWNPDTMSAGEAARPFIAPERRQGWPL